MAEQEKDYKPGSNDADVQVTAGKIDELSGKRDEQQSRDRKKFEQLQKRADAIDEVLMEKGDPTYDWSSG